MPSYTGYDEALDYLMLHKEDRQHLVNLIRAQYQNYRKIGETFVFLDGPNEGEKPELHPSLAKIPIEKLLSLLDLADVSKKRKHIILPDVLESIHPIIETNYDYPQDWSSTNTSICPATMRPYYYDPKTGQEWFNCIKGSYLPVYNYFIEYTKEYWSFPSRDQLILFMARRQVTKGWSTLPHCVEKMTQEVIDNYKQVVDTYNPNPNPMFHRYNLESSSMKINLFHYLITRSNYIPNRINLEKEYLEKHKDM